MNKMKVSPTYFQRKTDALAAKEISRIWCLAFRGEKSAVRELMEQEGDKYQIDCTEISKDSKHAEGNLALATCEAGVLQELIRKYPCLKWTFLFACKPFWERVSEEDAQKMVICAGFSDSGFSIANQYRVLEKCEVVERSKWMKKQTLRKLLNSEGYPFKSLWVVNRYVEIVDGEFLQRQEGNVKFIPSADDNFEKYVQYRHEMGKLKRAIHEGFFVEALMIIYTVIEDCLNSMLYYFGIIEDRNNLSFAKQSKPMMLEIYNVVQLRRGLKPSVSGDLKIDMISCKKDLLAHVIEWAAYEELPETSAGMDYLKSIRGVCESLDSEEILNVFAYIDWWLKYRNEIMHGLMNKNPNSVKYELEDIVAEGKQYMEFLQRQRKIWDKQNQVRKTLKMKYEPRGRS